MGKSTGRIHYDYRKISKTDFNIELDEIISSGISFMRINPLKDNLSLEEGQLIAAACKGKVDLIVVDDLDYALGIDAQGLYITSQELKVEDIMKAHPELSIGALAGSVAECKNWELKGVDYIELNVNPRKDVKPDLPTILGTEIFKDLISKEESYGWMILSLNTPVIVSGLTSISQLRGLEKHADFHGVLITELFENKAVLTDKVARILEVFK